MFVRQNQQQFRNSNADVQIFYGSGAVGSVRHQKSWLKPPGISHVYMLLIGGGGDGDGSSAGGGSGAVTVWYGAAQNVPDSLIAIAAPGNAFDTTVTARFSNSTTAPTAILTAASGLSVTGGTAMTANQFTASGFFQSVAGQDGASASSTSTTTFLSAGRGAGSTVTANYGYQTQDSGYFQMQPIIVGVASSSAVSTVKAGIGCGGAINASGGPGMVLIASW